MADVFVSYSQEDRERVAPLVRTLEQQGWSVWWDRNIRPGTSFRKAISDAIDSAQCVVVCWTRTSTESEWVCDEANEGKERNILVPVLLDDVKPPIGFRMTQLADLSRWASEEVSAELADFVNAVGDCLGQATELEVDPPQTPPHRNRRTLIAALAAAISALLVVVWLGSFSALFQTADPMSIAVVPFRDVSSSGDQDWIGQSIATEIQTGLNKVSGVRVSSGGTSRSYRDRGLDVREIGEELAVAYVIAGTTQRYGDRIRVTVQFVAVEDSYQRWSQVYQRNLDNDFAAETSIASDVVASISAELGQDFTPTLRISSADQIEPSRSLQGLLIQSSDQAFPQFGDDVEIITLDQEEGGDE